MQDLSSRVTTTENHAFNMSEVMHARVTGCARRPEFPELPAITHDYWGYIVPAERPPNWTVPDRTVAGAFAPAVLAQGDTVPAQDNPVSAVPALLVGGALNCNIVAVGENEVPVQGNQKNVANEAANHD
eukprot:3479088-Amphidinium_carterae.1